MKRVTKQFCGVVCSVFIILLTFTLTACNNNANQQRITQLESLLDSMRNVDSVQANTISEFFTSLDEIEQSLQLLTQKENALGKTMRNLPTGDIEEDSRESIKDQIQTIDRILSDNHNRLNALTRKLKASNIKVAELENLLTEIRGKLNERDSTIRLMVTQLDSLHISIDSLQLTVRDLDSTNQYLTDSLSQQHFTLNQAWYAIGTADELLENGVIERKRTHKSVGKHYLLCASPNLNYCTEISIEETQEIPIASTKKGVALVTSHPEQSYRMVENENGIVTKIEILQPDQFWLTSHFLVIIVK